MNLQFETAWQLHIFLTSRRIPYAIIGGIAVQRWGQPRLTRDVDLTILLPRGAEEATLRETGRFERIWAQHGPRR